MAVRGSFGIDTDSNLKGITALIDHLYKVAELAPKIERMFQSTMATVTGAAEKMSKSFVDADGKITKSRGDTTEKGKAEINKLLLAAEAARDREVEAAQRAEVKLAKLANDQYEAEFAALLKEEEAVKRTANVKEKSSQAAADAAARYAKLKTEYEAKSLDDVRAKIMQFEEKTRTLRDARANETDAEVKKELQSHINGVNAELQLFRSLEKEKIGRTFSEQMERLHLEEKTNKEIRALAKEQAQQFESLQHQMTVSQNKEEQVRLQQTIKELQAEQAAVKEEAGKRSINVKSVGGGVAGNVQGQLSNLASSATASMGPLGGVVDAIGGMGPIGMAAAAGVGAATLAISAAIDVGSKFEDQLADLSAITGVTGPALDKMGDDARKLATEFGTKATDQIGTYKTILSRLGPDIAKNPEALALMTKNVNILSKATGDDAEKSVDALTTAMLQFGVDLSDPAKAADNMTKMMNTMAAGAQAGASEVPQVAEALKAAGVAAKGAHISFEETNGALQVLSAGGKNGAEAGVALRNVLGLLQKQSGPGADALKGMGLSVKELGETLNTKGIAATMEKVKGGIDKLGTSAEKNATLMTLFGTENASAAGIMLDHVRDITKMTEAVTGTNTATEQAAIKQATFTERMKVVRAKVEDLAIGLYKTLQPALNKIADILAVVIDVLVKTGSIIGDVVGFFFRLYEVIYTKLYQVALQPLVTLIGKLIVQGYEWVKSLGFVQSIVKTVKDGISGMVDGIMKAYNAVKGFLETVGVLDKKAEKPIVVKAEVEAVPAADTLTSGLSKATADPKAEAKAAKADKDAYTAAKQREDIRFNQEKLALDEQLAKKFLTHEQYNEKLESEEGVHVTNLNDIASKHRKGHEQDALSAQAAMYALITKGNDKEVAAEKAKNDKLEKEREKAQKLDEKRQGILEKLQFEAIKSKLAGIKNENERELAEENARYDAEQIERQDDLMDLQTGKLVAEALETNHQNKLTAINKAGADKRRQELLKNSQLLAGPIANAFNAGFKNMMKGADDWTAKMAESGNILESVFGSMLQGFLQMIEGMIVKIVALEAVLLIANLIPGFGAFMASLDAIGSLIPGHAEGTDSSPGGWHWTGEKGPELVNMRPGAAVIPNHSLSTGSALDMSPVVHAINALHSTTAKGNDYLRNMPAPIMRFGTGFDTGLANWNKSEDRRAR